MRPLSIVEVKPLVQPLAQLDRVAKGQQVKILILERPPKPLNENVVLNSATAIRADGYFVLFQQVGEGSAGELSPLVSVEDIRCSIPAEGLSEGFNAKVGIQGIGHPPGYNLAAVPVHDSHKIHKWVYASYYVTNCL